MSQALLIVGFLLFLLFLSALLYRNTDFFKFLALGLDSGFTLKEVWLLYQAATFSSLEEPSALYFSVPALNNSISEIISDSQQDNTINTPKIQNLLEKLYNYRTRIELDPKNARGLKTTKSLQNGQKIRIILEGHGVFSSRVLNSGRELTITLPLQNGAVKIWSEDWVGRSIRVYLQRPNDAGYVFSTVVNRASSFNGSSVLMLEHTEDLFRSQKRKSVRCPCNIEAQLYIANSEKMSREGIESSLGLKCLLEDISETGALIRIGGKGKKNERIKIQFMLNDEIVVMFGLVRAVEFNVELNQSRLHFEGIGIPQNVKNIVLSYVYNVMPQNEKDEFDAINLAAEDSESDTNLTLEEIQNGIQNPILKSNLEDVQNTNADANINENINANTL